jgi:sugar-specific transcriptional regulator TrmB
MDRQQALERIGLTKNESRVYLALLQLGTSKTGEILKEAGLTSGKIYEILEGLKRKGLVSESHINGIKHFTAAPPVQLVNYLERKKESLARDEADTLILLPQLEKLRALKIAELRATVYSGLHGIKTAADESLAAMKLGEEIVTMGATSLKDTKYNQFWLRWQVQRVKRRITQRVIFSERSKYFEEFKQKRHTNVRVLTAITPVAVEVFGTDRTLILNYTEPSSAILIYDKNTATSFRHFFEQLWKIAKP